MLPRTYLSGRFPFRSWTTNASPPYTGFVYRQDIPLEYDERISMADALWDDGEKIVMVHWMDMTAYPSWNVTITWWDRSSGDNVQSLLGFWSVFSPDDQRLYNVEDPEWEALGTSADLGVPGSQAYHTLYASGLSPYVESVHYGADGSLYASQGGPWLAITPATLFVQPLQYGYFLGGASPVAKYTYDATAIEREADHASISFVQPQPVAPGTDSPPPPARPENDPFIAERTAAYQMVTGLLTRQSPRIAVFNPGTTDSALAMRFDEVGFPRCFLMIDSKRRTLITNLQSSYGSAIPVVATTAIVYIEAGVYRSHVFIPAMPYALGLDEGTRVWALCEDNTAVCFDYVTGEPFAYVWLPLPFVVTSQTQIAWQRDYRRLLVYGLLPGRDLSVARNSWDSRIVGYAIRPLPVRVCTPIPLRPVRAGRPTPFLVRQVGSLGEPLAGLATVTPGAGVTIDRAALALDDSGEARVFVTASAEGEASLSVSIDVQVTWDAPAVPQTFCPNGPWVEGSPD